MQFVVVSATTFDKDRMHYRTIVLYLAKSTLVVAMPTRDDSEKRVGDYGNVA